MSNHHVGQFHCPPPTSSALVTAIATIQAAMEASRDHERIATLILQRERATHRLDGNCSTSPPRAPSGRPIKPQLSRHLLPLDSTLTTSPPSTRRPPDFTTFGPSCPSFWTWCPLTTLAGEGRSSTPSGATPSTTMSLTTSCPVVPGLVPDGHRGALLAPQNYHRRALGHHPRPGRHGPSGVAHPRGTVPQEPGRSSSSPRRPVPPVLLGGSRHGGVLLPDEGPGGLPLRSR
jgi:hypothetical protein